MLQLIDITIDASVFISITIHKAFIDKAAIYNIHKVFTRYSNIATYTLPLVSRDTPMKKNPKYRIIPAQKVVATALASFVVKGFFKDLENIDKIFGETKYSNSEDIAKTINRVMIETL